MFWLLKQICSLPADMNTRNFKFSTYLRCAICAAVALCGPPICEPTEKTSSSDVVPSFVSCWSATLFAIFAMVGYRRNVRNFPPIPLSLKYQIRASMMFSTLSEARQQGREDSRGVEERQREAAFGREGRSVIEASSLFFLLSPSPKFPLCDTRFRSVSR